LYAKTHSFIVFYMFYESVYLPINKINKFITSLDDNNEVINCMPLCRSIVCELCLRLHYCFVRHKCSAGSHTHRLFHTSLITKQNAIKISQKKVNDMLHYQINSETKKKHVKDAYSKNSQTIKERSKASENDNRRNDEEEEYTFC